MQKRANLAIKYVPIPLPSALPICGGEPFDQLDAPIRYLHFHGCLELGLCYEGNGIFVVGDKVLPFSAGDVSFIEGTEVHLARSAPGTRSHWTWIYLDPVLMAHGPDTFDELDPAPFSGSNFCNIISGVAYPHVAQIVARLVEELRNKPAGYERMLRLLVCQFMLEMKRIAPRTVEEKPLSRVHYERLAPALARMATGKGETPSPGELATLCGLSEAHFRRLFKATMGRSPREYSFDLRMRLASSLLRGTAKTVLSISQDTGFHSLSSFNRVFQKTFAMSPREWRKAQNNLAE
ncbi:MAG TPA: AraC family transcriptional regulator [Abditibacteriaceae bacterium]|jgi:AraC-like DNA-binding protein